MADTSLARSAVALNQASGLEMFWLGHVVGKSWGLKIPPVVGYQKQTWDTNMVKEKNINT